MTPPVPKVKPAPSGAYFPAQTLLEKGTKKPIKSSPAFMADTKAAKAKTAPTKDDLKNLLPFLGDEQVFGIYLSQYQGEKAKKYQKVTLALLAIRNYLSAKGGSASGGKGEAGQDATAKQRVADWLSDAVLLEDKGVAHHARKNLIWVLERAKGDAGVDKILEALQANYAAAAEEKAKTRSYTKAEVQELLTEANIFGKRLEKYSEAKEGKYLKIAMTLHSLRKFLAGEGGLDMAKVRIQAWLGEGELKDDAISLRARKNMIRLFGVKVEDAKLAEDFKAVVEALTPDELPAEAPPAEEKKPPEKAPEPPKASATFVFPSPKAPGKRQDNFEVMMKKIKAILLSTYEAYLKSHPNLKVETVMRYKVDNKNGAVMEVRFMDIQLGDPSDQEIVQLMLKDIATQMYLQVSHEKQGSEKISEVEWPQITFKPPEKTSPK